MAAFLRAKGIAGAASGGDLIIAREGPCYEGDEIFILFGQEETLATVTISGFTKIGEVDGSITNRYSLFHKKAGASEPSTYTIDVASGTRWRSALMVVVGASHASNSIVTGTYQISEGSGTTIVAPAITTTADKSLLLFFGSHRDGTQGVSPPTGFGVTIQHDNCYLATSWQLTEGSTGDKTAAVGTDTNRAGILVAIEPSVDGPSRFHLSSTEAADVTPGYNGSWTRNTEGDRREMIEIPDGSSLNTKTGGGGQGFADGNTVLVRQYVSPPLQAGIAFATSDTIKAQAMGQESAANDNINRSAFSLRVVSEDGNTVRATLKTLGFLGADTAEWPTSLEDKSFANGDTLDNAYTTVSGDRLVAEFGFGWSGATGASVTGTLQFGAEEYAGLPENETEVGTLWIPWFEISREVWASAGPQTVQSGQINLAGTGDATITAKLEVKGASTITGVGSATPTAKVEVKAGATITGAGDATASGYPVKFGAATITGAGGATSTAINVAIAAATVSGLGDSTATATLIQIAAATLQGSSDATINSIVTVIATATLQGSGDASAAGGIVLTGAATLTGTGDASATGAIVVYGGATIAGTSDLTASGVPVKIGAATISGTSDLTATAINIVITGATIAGTSDATGAGYVTEVASATITGSGNLSASGDVAGIVTGAATIAGTGDATAVAINVAITGATIAGTGQATTTALVRIIAASTLTGVGDLSATASGFGTVVGAATITGIGELSSSGVLTIIGEASATATGQLSAAGISVVSGNSTLTGSGTATSAGLAISIGALLLTGIGSTIATAIVLQIATAQLSGLGTLAAAGGLPGIPMRVFAVASSAGPVLATASFGSDPISGGISSESGAVLVTGSE